jgi:hypothetical protein
MMIFFDDILVARKSMVAISKVGKDILDDGSRSN